MSNQAVTRQNETARETRNEPALLPPVDVIEDATGITLYADLPGVSEDKLHVQFGRDVSIYLAGADGTFPSFQNAVHYNTGGNGRSIVAGDFNGDSRLDLAVANQNLRTVSLLLGNADGTFAAALNIPVGTFVQPATGIDAQAVKAGDFNSDGRLDLVVLGGFEAGGLVLPGNGDGTFASQTQYPTGSGPFSVAIGDLNDDGRLDLAVATNDSKAVSVLLGNGDGTFATHTRGYLFVLDGPSTPRG